MKAHYALLSVLLVVSVPGCDSSAPTAMVTIPPPQDWEGEIAASRGAKDRQFKSDPNTPLLAEDVADFGSLDYWDPDPRFYFVGSINYYERPERFEIISTSGEVRPCEKVGWVAFDVGGQQQRLQVYRLLDVNAEGTAAYFLPFMDGTTGAETYPSGRYVELVGPSGGPYVLDFNTTYNPLCAYGAPERYTCPVTPPENRLQVRIEAGERGFRHPPEQAGSEG